MYRLSLNFNDHVAEHSNVVKLIEIADKNGDSVLDPTEVRELLKVSTPPCSRRRNRQPRVLAGIFVSLTHCPSA